MILKKLSEARTKGQNAELIKEIKEKDSRLAQLRDTTVGNIITVFKKDMNGDLIADDIISWFNESPTLAEFFFLFAEDLSTYSISDLAEHDEKLAKAIKAVLKSDNIINDAGQDVTLHYDQGETPRSKPLSVEEMCIILFNQLSESPVREYDDVSNVDPKLLKDKSVFDIRKFMDNVAQVKKEYNNLGEALKEAEEPEVPEMTAEPEIPAEPSPEVEKVAFSEIINSAIQKEWDLVSELNGIIATFDFEYNESNKEDVISILNQLVDDTTISIGMLHKVSELVSNKTAELLDAGEAKAENIISEE